MDTIVVSVQLMSLFSTLLCGASFSRFRCRLESKAQLLTMKSDLNKCKTILVGCDDNR